MFAVDGVKLPSNAAKSKSGKRSDFKRQLTKLEVKIKTMIESHQANDAEMDRPSEDKILDRLQKEAEQLKAWLQANPRKGAVLSNRTDNESAKMATSKGGVQGYTGVAAVDQKHQIIIEAEAYGTGAEQGLLIPMANQLKKHMCDQTALTADSGYHSQAGLEYLAENGINAFIPDNGYRKRDARYAEQEKHHSDKPDPLYNKSESKQVKKFRTSDFKLLEDKSGCLCPAGKVLYRAAVTAQ